uniref:Vitamin K epoxide reductase domain-containing protein n=1 Tax=viral metagenome TaxID=1070528 RepID=A0A6C0CUI7_9ZZZZ
MNEKKIISSSIAILFNYLLFSYIQRLEKIGCDCGLEKHSNIVKSSIIINYIIIFGKLFTKSVPPVTIVLISLSDIVFTIYTFIFLYRLKTEKCKCSDSTVRDVYYYYYLLVVILIALLISLLLVYIVF